MPTGLVRFPRDCEYDSGVDKWEYRAKLLDDAAQEGDMAKRAELLKKANNLLYEEAPVWFFNYNKAVLAYQPWVHGLQPNPTEITHQYLEDVWVDANSPAK